MSVFITGTDTGVGKTSFTVWLLQSLRARGVSCAGYKPICCGDRDDAVQLHTAGTPGLTIDEINPLWLRTAAAPLAAAQAEGREIDLAPLREGFFRLRERCDFIAVEGVGGWMVPIKADYLSSDLARELGLPVVVIALNRLGCLNHSLLTVRAVESAGLPCAGVVLNQLAPDSEVATATNAEILRDCLPCPVLGRFERDQLEVPPSLVQMLPELGDLLSTS